VNISHRQRTNCRQETALIVNSRRQECETIREFLSDADYNVLSANTGDEAMELCRNYEGAIHLLVTDTESAGASGWDLAETAARMRPGLVILFLSQETVQAGGEAPGGGSRVDPLALLRLTHALGRKPRQDLSWN
jgi:response regulator RpfG family c-di-GMP phosphodiesterase